MAIAAIVYVVRLEGRLDVLTAILKRVEAGQTALETRYNFDGKYGVTIHGRAIGPAE